MRYDVLIKDFIALGQNEASWFPPVSSLCVINPNYLLVATSHANYFFESGVSLLWLKKANEHVSFYVDFSSVIMINTERCLHTRRAKYSFTLSLLKEPVGFFGWMSPYAASLTHKSCRPEAVLSGPYDMLSLSLGLLGLHVWDQTHTALKSFLCFT